MNRSKIPNPSSHLRVALLSTTLAPVPLQNPVPLTGSELSKLIRRTSRRLMEEIVPGPGDSGTIPLLVPAVRGPPQDSGESSGPIAVVADDMGSCVPRPNAVVAPPGESSGRSAVVADAIEALHGHAASSGPIAVVGPPGESSGRSAVVADAMESSGLIEAQGASFGSDEALHGDAASSGPIAVVAPPGESTGPIAVVAAAMESSGPIEAHAASSGPDEALHGDAASSGPIETLHSDPMVRLSGGSDPIVALYCEAARRLPIYAMPQLGHCLLYGGHCIGLLDPVSNIILNTLNLLCHWREGNYTPKCSDRLHADPEDESTWSGVAFTSYCGQIVFLQSYFRYLSDAQARRYIYLSGADLAAAIWIAEHERPATHEDRDCLPDLVWDAAQFSLRLAAISAQHPIPDDVVLLCQPLIQESKDIRDVVFKLQESHNQCLNSDDIEHILSVLQSHHRKISSSIQVTFPWRQTAPGMLLDYSFNTTGGRVSAMFNFQPQAHLRLRNLRCSKGAVEKVTSYLSSIHNFRQLDSPHTWKDIAYLKMCLLDALHAFYVKALSRLPKNIRGDLLSSMLLAGYCYGPFDPITNIIVNSMWYRDTAYDMEVCVPHVGLSGYAKDILFISSMRRLEVCSLDGLLAAVRTITGLSEYDVVLHLCKTHLCSLTSLLGNKMPEVLNVAFHNTSDAAKHPLGESHAKFLACLSCDTELAQELVYLLHTEEGELCSVDRLVKAEIFLQRYCPKYEIVMDLDVPQVEFFPGEAMIEEMVLRQRFLRKEIEKLLHSYSSQHPWEPVYELQTICGGEKSTNFLHSNCYHINFLAAQSDEETTPKLFFAQIWESKFKYEQPDVIDGSEISFCCPLPNYNMRNVYPGRCSICEPQLGKVVHPPCGMHAGVIDFEKTLNYMNTCASKESFIVDGIIGLELVLFEKAMDRHFTKVLQYMLSSPFVRWEDAKDRGMEMMVGLRLAFAELMRCRFKERSLDFELIQERKENDWFNLARF